MSRFDKPARPASKRRRSIPYAYEAQVDLLRGHVERDVCAFDDRDRRGHGPY